MKPISILLILLALYTFPGCVEGNSTAPEPNMQDDATEVSTLNAAINNLPTLQLTPGEITGLIHMREEEKLARDVYQHLFDTYGSAVFSNISRSEARHMTAMKALLDKYGITDPVVSDARGVFTDAHFQDLYTQLTTAGDKSLLDAMLIGATIEDLDIKDLMDLSAATVAQDLLLVYGNLTRGSQNHLRAFHTQIVLNNGTYTPQYISQALYDTIINAKHQRGRRW